MHDVPVIMREKQIQQRYAGTVSTGNVLTRVEETGETAVDAPRRFNSGERGNLVLKNKKYVKTVALTVAALFVLGVVGMAVSTTGKGYAAGASSNIGKVNYQALVSQHPDMAKMNETMQAEVTQAQQDFNTKSANMNEKEKQDYYMQVQQRLSLKERELIAPIYDKVDAAIKAVADAKGLAVIMDAGNVVYGGQDITEDVLKKLK